MALERCVFLSHFLELDSRRFIGIYPVNMFPSKMKLVVYKKLAGIYSTKARGSNASVANKVVADSD